MAYKSSIYLIIILFLTLGISACGGSNDSKNKNSSSSEASSQSSSVSSSDSSQSLSSSSVSSQSSSSTRDTLSSAIEKAALTGMEQTGATAVMIAVTKNGKIIHDESYGFYDKEKLRPLDKNALMRTASIVKGVTAAAIRKLASSGALSLSDHVFCNGNNAPCWLSENLLSPNSDARVAKITIEHLIKHLGGFYAQEDPINIGIQAQCDKLLPACPATKNDLIKYRLASPLNFEPGDDSVSRQDGYSNFGYMILGMIVEQATGKTFAEYVQETIFLPLGVSVEDFKAAKGMVKDHDPREPIYISTQTGPSAYNIGKMAPVAEEGVLAENLTSVGFGLTSARAMALFATGYLLPFGEPIPNDYIFISNNDDGISGRQDGLWDGTATSVIQYKDGMTVAIFVNKLIQRDQFQPIIRSLRSAMLLDE